MPPAKRGMRPECEDEGQTVSCVLKSNNSLSQSRERVVLGMDESVPGVNIPGRS